MTSLVTDAAWRVGKIAAPLGKALLFSAADERIAYKKELCISVEKGGVSVAYGTRFLSSISVKGVRHYPFKEHVYPQPKETASAVMLAAKELGISVSSITLSIPKAWAAVKIAEFPATVKENMPGVITYELDRLVPFSPESAYYDFLIAGETAEKITVVVAAAKAEVIRSYCEAIHESGINVDRVTLNITAKGDMCLLAAGEKDFFLAGAEPDNRSTAAGVVTESLRPGAHRLDLLSRGRHVVPERPKALSIILVLLFIACWIFYMVTPVQLERKRLDSIERQVKLRKNGMKDLDVLRKDIDAANSQIETVADFKGGGPTTLAIIKELTTVLPKSVWLTRVRTTRSTVEIEGYSSSASELLSRLEASKYFSKAEFSSPTFRDMRMSADRFTIKMEIRGVKEEKGVQQKNEKK